MLMSNGEKKSNSLPTCSVAVSITRAFGTNIAVLVFLINVTDSTGIEICRGQNRLYYHLHFIPET